MEKKLIEDGHDPEGADLATQDKAWNLIKNK
jgi:hypothetical protein